VFESLLSATPVCPASPGGSAFVVELRWGPCTQTVSVLTKL
jgi:hypothetical protein